MRWIPRSRRISARPRSPRVSALDFEGLGQLAYDKAILVLAASQTDEVAVGLPGLRHGLLTYTLLEGLGSAGAGRPRAAGEVGRLTLAGLLRYARDQAPEVYRAAKAEEPERRGVAAAAEPWAPGALEALELRWPRLGGGGEPGRATARTLRLPQRKARSRTRPRRSTRRAGR